MKTEWRVVAIFNLILFVVLVSFSNSTLKLTWYNNIVIIAWLMSDIEIDIYCIRMHDIVF